MTGGAINGSPWRDFYVHMLNKSTILRARTIVAGFILLFGFQFAARADETYTYTGNEFGGSPSSPYLASDFVSGFFTVASAIGNSQAFGTVPVTSYSFSDGVQTFSSASNPASETTFEVATDGSGNPIQWTVTLTSGGLNIVSTTQSEDLGESGLDVADNFLDPGTWLKSSSGGGGSTVPEPGYPVVIALGLAAIVTAHRKLQRSRT